MNPETFDFLVEQMIAFCIAYIMVRVENKICNRKKYLKETNV